MDRAQLFYWFDIGDEGWKKKRFLKGTVTDLYGF